jgi:mRNA-degrading endonuclease RelE of RelBE toxin-antitoxin system
MIAFAALPGSAEYRFRIGDYRVILEVLHDTLWVTAIKRRDEAYR